MQTKDYEKFKIMNCNRKLNRNHINELKEAITKFGYLDACPIMVNRDYEIIDGQHRFIACQEMGIPIPYQFVENGDDLIITLNTTQKKWSLEDYVNYWASKGYNPHYERLKNICKELGMSATMVITILSNGITSGSNHEPIKKGNLKFTLEDSLKVRGFYSNMTRFCKVVKMKPTTRLCTALMQLSTRSGFAWQTLLSKAERYPTVAYNCRTKEEFFVMLRDLYNFNTRKVEGRI